MPGGDWGERLTGGAEDCLASEEKAWLDAGGCRRAERVSADFGEVSQRLSGAGGEVTFSLASFLLGRSVTVQLYAAADSGQNARQQYRTARDASEQLLRTSHGVRGRQSELLGIARAGAYA